MTSDLFSEHHDRTSSRPLAARMRPLAVDDVVGQDHLLAAGSPLRRLLDGSDTATASVLLWGPPGVGKTTLASIAARASGREFLQLSAVSAGVKDIRSALADAVRSRQLHGRATVLFVDEIHRFSKATQDALLPGVEDGTVTLIAATTENPSFSVISPLLSRSLLLTLRPLDAPALAALMDRAVADPRGLAGAVKLTDAARDMLVRAADGDGRRSLTALEAAAGTALARHNGDGPAPIEPSDVEAALQRTVPRYDTDGDSHYDTASAFQKSIRGSDVDAALHYLARMVEAGEDPRFITRRLIVIASEDIGMADPTALQTAVAAHAAVQAIGMPEGRIVLSQAVIHLALAPKSNAAYLAIGAALEDLAAGRSGPIPAHLRDAHYPGAKRLGHGRGYQYAHDVEGAIAEQQYLPDALADRRYYTPSGRGFEARLTEVLASVRSKLGRR